MYRKFNVTIQFRERIYGGLPKSEEMVKKYVQAKFQSDDTSIVETDLDLQEETDQITTGFKRDERGIYVGTYQLKAAMKQYASLLRLTTKKRGSKQTVKEAMFIKGRVEDELTDEKIYFQPFREKPDGIEDFVGQVQTAQGSRSILKASEYIEKGSLQFQIWCLDVRMGQDGRSKDVIPDDLQMCLEFGQECGIGANRSFEKGKYNLIAFEPVE